MFLAIVFSLLGSPSSDISSPTGLLLNLSHFLRVHAIDGATPPREPWLYVLVHLLLLMMDAISLSRHRVEVVNRFPVLLRDHGQKLQKLLRELLTRTSLIISHGCALQQVFHDVDKQDADQLRLPPIITERRLSNPPDTFVSPSTRSSGSRSQSPCRTSLVSALPPYSKSCLYVYRTARSSFISIVHLPCLS